jgi:glycine reductase
MKLELRKIMIKNIAFSDKTVIRNRKLLINKDELSKLIKKDSNIKQVEIKIARPGESVRIVPIIDILQPRKKISSEVSIFPGILSGIDNVGEGRTNVLDGCAVMTSSKDLIHFTEGLVDMSGLGAKYSVFSKLNNIILIITPTDNANKYQFEMSVRNAGIKATEYLGKCACNIDPDNIEIFEFDSISNAIQKYPDLPRIVYVNMLISQRKIDNTLYGVDTKGILPTFISPTEVLDGAIVGGLTTVPCHRNTTYHQCNNPVITELLRRHGKDLCFIGVILTNEPLTLPDKEKSAYFVSRIAKNIGAQGAIVTVEGAGNAHTDLMLNCKYLEQSGIKTVLIADEMAGQDGTSESFADITSNADAIVSTGNINEVLNLPAMDRVIGSLKAIEKITGGGKSSLKKDGSIKVETAIIMGSLSTLGVERITIRIR